jgi:hypothetical protein
VKDAVVKDAVGQPRFGSAGASPSQDDATLFSFRGVAGPSPAWRCFSDFFYKKLIYHRSAKSDIPKQPAEFHPFWSISTNALRLGAGLQSMEIIRS